MSQDVEIIEDDKQIIDISDESCEFVLETDNDVEEILQIAYGNELSRDRINKESFNNSTSSDGNTAESLIDICENEIKQENNNMNNDNSVGRDNIVVSMNNCVSHVIKSENLQTNKRRKRSRGRWRKKNSCAVTKQLESNSLNNNDQLGNSKLSNSQQSTWSSSNTNTSTTYDFSKLKWLKPLSNLTSPPHLQLVIIDRSHPFWRIENQKWLMVEKRLLEALNREMIRTNDPRIGLFDGAKWQKGIKIVGCHNEDAFDFIVKFLLNMDKLWNGAKLDAFPITHISRHVVKGYIPPPTIKTEVIMSLIKLQNPSMYCNDWKVVRERERADNGGIDIWISVNDQSFMQLRSVGGEIKFGINRIFLNPSS